MKKEVKAMPLWIMCFNLKDGASEEELVKLLKEYSDMKIEGFGSSKLYCHHLVGANRRTYQLHMEFKDFAAWDKLLAYVAKDAKGTRFYQKWRNLIDMKTHYDEFVREIPL